MLPALGIDGIAGVVGGHAVVGHAPPGVVLWGRLRLPHVPCKIQKHVYIHMYMMTMYCSGLRVASWTRLFVLWRAPIRANEHTTMMRPDNARASQVQPRPRSSCACLLEHMALAASGAMPHTCPTPA